MNFFNFIIFYDKIKDKYKEENNVNTSNKLAETKTIDGLEVSNIRLTEKNNVSRICLEKI